jgi:hypothetical protein
MVPKEVSLFGLISGLLVPGLAVYFRSPDLSGKAALAVCGALLLVFIVFLGFPVANVAFTILLSIHLVGLTAYCKPLFAGMEWPARLLAGLLLAVMTIVVIYLPLQYLFEQRLFLPMRRHDHVVVIRCLKSPEAIGRGEWVAYRISNSRNYFNEGGRHGNVIVRGGVNMAPMLALAGDKVEFSTNSFSVNGVAQPLLVHMPQSGRFIVPGNCWFAWPEMDILAERNMPAANITGAMMEMSIVRTDQLVGRAFKHWFWRRQIFS